VDSKSTNVEIKRHCKHQKCLSISTFVEHKTTNVEIHSESLKSQRVVSRSRLGPALSFGLLPEVYASTRQGAEPLYILP